MFHKSIIMKGKHRTTPQLLIRVGNTLYSCLHFMYNHPECFVHWCKYISIQATETPSTGKFRHQKVGGATNVHLA